MAQFSDSYFGDDRQQAVLERIKDKLGKSFDQTDIFPYSLVCENVMGSNNSYLFPINSKNQLTNTLPLQQGLLDSDLYLFYELAITVDARVSTLPSSVIRWQFGNSTVFNATANTGTATDIETFYNAKLSLNVSNVAKIQGLSTTAFRHVGSPAVAIGETAATPTFATIQNYGNDIKYEPTTIITLLGADQNAFQIDLTFGSSTPSITNTATNGQNVVSILTNGFRIPQGTNAYRALLQGIK
jgi:hypothetical protein